MSSHYIPRLLAFILILALGMMAAHAQSGAFLDAPGARHRLFKDLVQARSEAIDAAFPGFLAICDFKLAIAPVKSCARATADLACYDAAQNTLTFDREVVTAIDSRLFAVAENYWMFYEHAELRAAFPVIGVIDGALWSAFMSKIAEQHDSTWPHESCGSIHLDRRLGCEMLVSGIESQLRFKHSRIYNANRLDRLWPDDLDSLERSGWSDGDREYADVRDLGGVELLRPLIKEFGAARVFAYVAQTPFAIEDNDVKASALGYQARARRTLKW